VKTLLSQMLHQWRRCASLLAQRTTRYHPLPKTSKATLFATKDDHGIDPVVGYQKLAQNVSHIQSKIARPLSYAEKVIYSHLQDLPNQQLPPKQSSYLTLTPGTHFPKQPPKPLSHYNRSPRHARRLRPNRHSTIHDLRNDKNNGPNNRAL